jgi:hypothetical protein
MIRGIQYSRPLVAAGAVAVVASCTMIWLSLELNAKISEQRRRASSLEASLSGQIAAKSVYESEDLDALRDKVGRFRVRLGSEGTWERLVRQFGDGWTAESGPKDDKNGYCIQYGTFKLLSPAVADWPKIIEAVKDSEAIPGVGVAEIEMKSSGGHDRRSLDLVRILVAVQTSRTGLKPVIAP